MSAASGKIPVHTWNLWAEGEEQGAYSPHPDSGGRMGLDVYAPKALSAVDQEKSHSWGYRVVWGSMNLASWAELLGRLTSLLNKHILSLKYQKPQWASSI